MPASRGTPRPALPRDIRPVRYRLAFSGGLDSQVLLDLMAALRGADGRLPDGARLDALHVDHGLSPNSTAWARHCAERCAALDVPFLALRVDATPGPGESPEAAARRARYAALAGAMERGDCLLTAHHQDDQAETLLLQLLRGAGPRGLASMPPLSPFAAGWHARPLLHLRRTALRAHAEARGLSWLEDESNADTGLARNFLRHMVLPRLRARYPAVAATLSRSARRCAEADALLGELAEADLALLRRGTGGVLSVSGLQALGERRGRNALHHWIHARGLPLPSEAQLGQLWRTVLGADADAAPLLRWPGVEVRRYRDELYLGAPLTPVAGEAVFAWDLRASLALPGVGRLHARPAGGAGVAARHVQGRSLEVRFRRGGERLCVAGRHGHHRLKTLFQEAGIAPWRRDRLPLVYLEGQLLAVAGLWVACEFAAEADEAGIRFDLSEDD